MNAHALHHLLVTVAGAWGIALVALLAILLISAWWALKQ